MIARSFWGAKADKGSAEKRDEPDGEGGKPPVDDLLDARFVDDGRLAEPRKGGARSPDRTPTVDELDLAVQKLSEGLEAIERQSRAEPDAEGAPELVDPQPQAGSERDFVAHSLDRLEARLEALSKRLQQRGAAEAPSSRAAPSRQRPQREEPLPVTMAEVEALEEDAEDEEDVAAQLAEFASPCRGGRGGGRGRGGSASRRGASCGA